MEFIVCVLTAYAIHNMVAQCFHLLKELNTEPQQRKQQLEEDPFWDELPEGPVYGDPTDYGAVDEALKLVELQECEANEQDIEKKKALTASIRAHSDLLVELTLLPFGPPPATESTEASPDPSKIIPFSIYKPYDDPDKR